MKKIFNAFLLLFFISCQDQSHQTDKQIPDQNPGFEIYREQFVEALWNLYPGWASSVGYHKYDSILTVSTPAQREKEMAFIAANLDSLQL